MTTLNGIMISKPKVYKLNLFYITKKSQFLTKFIGTLLISTIVQYYSSTILPLAFKFNE
jgi:hypothetical protein